MGKVRLRDLDPAIFLNKVGIGTDNPAEMLDVVGGNVRIGKTTNGRLTIENSSGTEKIKLDSAGDCYIGGGDLGVAGHITIPNAKSYKVKNSSGVGLDVVSLDSSNRLILGSQSIGGVVWIYDGYSTPSLSVQGQKVGIGSTAPTANLQIHSDNPGGGARMFDVSTQHGNIFSVVNGHHNRDDCYLRSEGVMYLGTNADIDAVRIDGGKVGIGTGSTAPSAMLVVANASSDPSIYIGENNGTNILQLKYDITSDVGIIEAWNTTSTTLRVNPSGGKVGIGTGSTAPSAKLEVGGSNARIRVHSTNENANQSLIELGSDLEALASKDSYMKFFSSAALNDRSWAIGAENTAFKFKYLGDRNIPPSYDATSTNPQPQNLFEIQRTGIVRIGATDGASKLNVGGDICLLANNSTADHKDGITEHAILCNNEGGSGGKEFNLADITRDTASWGNSNYIVEIFAHYPSGGSYAKYFVYYAYSSSGVITLENPKGVNTTGYAVRLAGEQTVSGNIKRASIMVDLPAYGRATIKLTHNGVYNIDEWTSSNENLAGRIKYNL